MHLAAIILAALLACELGFAIYCFVKREFPMRMRTARLAASTKIAVLAFTLALLTWGGFFSV